MNHLSARLRFALPGDDRTIDVGAEVVASEISASEMSTHLRFVDLSDEDRERIEKLTVHASDGPRES